MNVHGMDIRGKFWIQRIPRISDIPWTPAAVGRLLYEDATNQIYFGANSQWRKPQSTSDLFNTGQEIVFASTPLPTGWNIKPDMADKLIFLTNTQSQVGVQGGSWLITGLTASGSHNHFAPTGLGPALIDGRRGLSDITAHVPLQTHTHEMYYDGNHVHSFDGSWRPQYRFIAVGVFAG
jgi:hypothetical protein